MKRLCQENGWLRDELSSTQLKLQESEQKLAAVEEEKKHLEFMNEMKKYDPELSQVVVQYDLWIFFILTSYKLDLEMEFLVFCKIPRVASLVDILYVDIL